MVRNFFYTIPYIFHYSGKKSLQNIYRYSAIDFKLRQGSRGNPNQGNMQSSHCICLLFSTNAIRHSYKADNLTYDVEIHRQDQIKIRIHLLDIYRYVVISFYVFESRNPIPSNLHKYKV